MKNKDQPKFKPGDLIRHAGIANSWGIVTAVEDWRIKYPGHACLEKLYSPWHYYVYWGDKPIGITGPVGAEMIVKLEKLDDERI